MNSGIYVGLTVEVKLKELGRTKMRFLAVGVFVASIYKLQISKKLFLVQEVSGLWRRGGAKAMW